MRLLTRFPLGSGSSRALSGAVLLLPLASLAASSCSQRSVAVQLRPLQASGQVSYICRDEGGHGRPIAECNSEALDRGTRELYALLTQTVSGEVAVINVPWAPTTAETGRWFVDQDPTSPGYNFIRVGSRPGSIVSSPGGEATFVTVGEAGKPGIFALPTSCVGRPEPSAPRRDLTTWPACSLTSSPGEMKLVVQAPQDGAIYESCLGSALEQPRVDDPARECPADLTTEPGPKGRRKLVVTLPDEGKLVVVDAQWLLDQPQGSFGRCQIEAEHPLEVQLPASPVKPVFPPDLANACSEALPSPPVPPAFAPRPSGLALSEDRLYVGDRSAPVIHVLDMSNVCTPKELQPLLPQSFERPGRVVTTTRLAVSPLTPLGKRFLYAVDELDTPRSSLMAFDVSPGSTERTPIVRPGAEYMPYEAPDRIQFAAPVRDVAFIERDRPVVDPVTGAITVGTACDPEPKSSSLGVAYRSNSDYTRGARARELRGVFGAALLTNGRVQIVDVEDFDAPCRRPVNARMSPDKFSGCADTREFNYYAVSSSTSSLRIVTDELSCRMVEPHRARSSTLAIASADAFTEAPSLRSWPTFKNAPGAEEPGPLDGPQMLGVDFDTRPSSINATDVNVNPMGDKVHLGRARVYLGNTLYDSQYRAENPLSVNPNTATNHSLVLPFVEPRAYNVNEDLLLTYQGQITGTVPAGFLRQEGERWILSDPAFAFCDTGVHDVELMRELGAERFALAGDALESFAVEHADRLVLRGDFPAEEDGYWDSLAQVDGRDIDRNFCIEQFGRFDADKLDERRKFRILDAEQQRLEIEPMPRNDRVSPELRMQYAHA
ncbi:MAG TPA: hypothetical protein VFQ61_11445, partial [Polyangiaceae bacterium]|nr:hypothetical protein [Polyangiaceae bacterium]